MPRSLYPLARGPPVLIRKLGRPWKRRWKETCPHVPRIEPWFSGRPPRSLVTVRTKLCQSNIWTRLHNTPQSLVFRIFTQSQRTVYRQHCTFVCVREYVLLSNCFSPCFFVLYYLLRDGQIGCKTPITSHPRVRVSFTGLKRLGRGVNHWSPSSDGVKQWLELYLCSPYVTSGPARGKLYSCYLITSTLQFFFNFYFYFLFLSSLLQRSRSVCPWKIISWNFERS